jgi:hypothetical protein
VHWRGNHCGVVRADGLPDVGELRNAAHPSRQHRQQAVRRSAQFDWALVEFLADDDGSRCGERFLPVDATIADLPHDGRRHALEPELLARLRACASCRFARLADLASERLDLLQNGIVFLQLVERHQA